MVARPLLTRRLLANPSCFGRLCSYLVTRTLLTVFRFYLLINIGAFIGVATAYLAKYVGFWASYLLPGIIYFMLPVFLIWVNKVRNRLVSFCRLSPRLYLELLSEIL